jgi:DNA-binding NarL/FixJ family response regulator
LAQAPALPWGALVGVPDLASLGLAEALRHLAPGVRLLLALPPDPSLCREAWDLEVSALLSAAHLAQELPPCLAKLDRGRRFLSPHLPLGDPMAAAPAGLASLTKGELEVLALLAEEKDVPQIAGELFVGECTVRSHRANLLAKLGLAKVGQLGLFIGKHQAAILAWWESKKSGSQNDEKK